MATDHHLYAFGSNGSGQLGVGHTEDLSVPAKCTLPGDSKGSIIKLATGGSHALVISPSGTLYTTGENGDGRSGQGPSRVGFEKFSFFDSIASTPDSTIKLCSASWEASILVKAADRLFSLGSGSKGELGLGEDVCTAPTEQIIRDFPPAGSQVIDISSCVAHTVVVLSTGEVYGWGNGRKGQLGQPGQICWKPRKIEGIGFKVIRAVCGREFTYLVGEPAEGKHVILGSDKWEVRSQAPQSIPGWMDVGASWGSIYVLMLDGTLSAWGRNDHGQLPTSLPLLRKIGIGSEHVLALTHDGKLLAWGWGEHGNCGQPINDAGDVKGGWNEITVQNPDTSSRQSIADIQAGCATSWIWAHP